MKKSKKFLGSGKNYPVTQPKKLDSEVKSLIEKRLQSAMDIHFIKSFFDPTYKNYMGR